MLDSITELGDSLRTGYQAWLTQLRMSDEAVMPQDWEILARLQTDAAQSIEDIQGWIALESWLTSGFFPTSRASPLPESDFDRPEAVFAVPPVFPSPTHSPANVTPIPDLRLLQPDQQIKDLSYNQTGGRINNSPYGVLVPSSSPTLEPNPHTPASPAPIGGLRDLAQIVLSNPDLARMDHSRIPVSSASPGGQLFELSYENSAQNPQVEQVSSNLSAQERDKFDKPGQVFGLPGFPSFEQIDDFPHAVGQSESLSDGELEKMALGLTENAQRMIAPLEMGARPDVWKVLRLLSGPKLVGNPKVVPVESAPAASRPFEPARQAAERENPLGEMPGIVRRMVETEPAAGQTAPNFSEMDVQDLLDALKREVWREYERFYGPVR